MVLLAFGRIPHLLYFSLLSACIHPFDFSMFVRPYLDLVHHTGLPNSHCFTEASTPQYLSEGHHKEISVRLFNQHRCLIEPIKEILEWLIRTPCRKSNKLPNPTSFFLFGANCWMNLVAKSSKPVNDRVGSPLNLLRDTFESPCKHFATDGIISSTDKHMSLDCVNMALRVSNVVIVLDGRLSEPRGYFHYQDLRSE